MSYNFLDKDFKPAILELRKFNSDVLKSGRATRLIIAVERNNGYVYRKELNVFEDGIDDERNILYREYFRILKTISPKFFLIENVVGILTFAKGAIVSDIKRRADELGYEIFIEVLNTQDYGIPQIRRRVFFVGIKKELVHSPFSFPKPTFEIVTAEEAIGDLPSLDKNEDNTAYNKWIKVKMLY